MQINPQVVSEIRHYLVSLGHAALSDAPPQILPIAALPSSGSMGFADEPLSATRLYRVLKDFFRDVAMSAMKADRDTAEKIRSASTHWQRHYLRSTAFTTG